MTPKRYLLTAGIIISVQMGLLAGVYAYSGTQVSNLVTSSADNSKNAESTQSKISLALRFTSQAKAPKAHASTDESAGVDHKPEAALKPEPKLVQRAPANTPKKLTQAITAKAPNMATKTRTSAEKATNTSSQQLAIRGQIPTASDSGSQSQGLDAAVKTSALASHAPAQHQLNLSKPKFAAPPTKPNYPRLARKRGLQGTALVAVLFDNLGKQLELSLVDSSGAAILDEAALDAVKLWQFSPPSPQSALAYRVQVPVTFALN